eukprot:COSAG01_NODE_40642_length_461_cov_0.947514_1_plen_99_part_10
MAGACSYLQKGHDFLEKTTTGADSICVPTNASTSPLLLWRTGVAYVLPTPRRCAVGAAGAESLRPGMLIVGLFWAAVHPPALLCQPGASWRHCALSTWR